MPGRSLPRLHEPLLLPIACVSVPLPWRTSPWPGFVCLKPPRGQTCHSVGIAGGGNSPPPGPLSCLARGSARSGPGVWSDSWPSLDSTPLGTPHILSTNGRKYYKSIATPGEGGGGPFKVPPSHHVLDLTVGRQ